MATIYKICPAALWRDAVVAGIFRGSPVDLADGFIHFSTAAQVAETAAKYFTGQDDLVLAAFDDGEIGDVRYELSRGGQLFPHLYAPLDPKDALWVRPMTMRADGTHILPITLHDL
jgi:uncharacterized protein (DUF952 family)